jgi:pentatricopeptide repeat protein
MALVYNNQGDYLEYYEKALAIRLEALGANHPDVATTYNNMASVYGNEGDYAKALELYVKALAIWLEAPGDNHPNTKAFIKNIEIVKGSWQKCLNNTRLSTLLLKLCIKEYDIRKV